MGLKRNILSNYASQIYVTAIGILMVPLYIKYMGAEAYGLIGFFAMLQTWFQMLDMGLSPTLSRQTARLSARVISVTELRRLLRVLEGIFVIVGLAGAILLIINSNWLAVNWLKAQTLSSDQVRLSIQIIAVIISLRWISGLYRGAIVGFEQQRWLAGVDVGMATSRFVVVILIFETIGTTPVLFFSWQLLITILEATLLVCKTYHLLHKIEPRKTPVGWHWYAITNLMGFSLNIAFISAVWVGVTQTDKLVLSKILPLSEYGYFTLAVLVASGVLIISGPISMAILPRMARLEALGSDNDLLDIYRKSTQVMAVVVAPVTIVLSLFAGHVIVAWTGDAVLAKHTAEIMSFYAAGNGIFAMAAFPYYLQFAKGNVRMHLYGSVLFLFVLIPALVWASSVYGGVGAGYAWLLTNALYLAAWVPFVHKIFMPGKHLSWLYKDVLLIVAPSLLLGFALQHSIHFSLNRIVLIFELIASGALLLVMSSLFSSEAREIVSSILRQNRI